MRLADYVFAFVAAHHAPPVFFLPGGGCMHLCDALGQSGLEAICCLHEQAVSVAAEAYGQHTNRPGVALVTTGPGGTNAMTGLLAAWIDSTPCLFISGQVKRADIMAGKGVRQMGNQEADIVAMVTPITKYAVTVMEPDSIRYHLERAWHEATTGRKGPVWIDIPLDVQAMDIEPEALPGYTSSANAVRLPDVAAVWELLRQAKRPLLLAGNGIKLADASKKLIDLIEQAGLPAVLTWKTLDMLPAEHPLFFGCPGGMGHRYANYLLQTCDVLLIIGSRLDPSLTAYDHDHFAPHAKKIMVDIDPAEMDKMTCELAGRYECDAGLFLEAMCIDIPPLAVAAWLDYARRMKAAYPAVLPEYLAGELVNTYVFVDALARQMTNTDVLVPESAGSAGEVTYQAFTQKAGQRIKNAAGLGAMGFGLPYAIGACIANDGRRTVLINGDGAFQLNIQELETLQRLGLPVKMFIWCNDGYASIQNMQRNNFSGRLVGSSADSGFTVPDMLAIARAYGIATYEIANHDTLEQGIAATLVGSGPALCVVRTDPRQLVAPRTIARQLPDGRMISGVMEDMWPFLERDEQEANLRAALLIK